MKRIAPLILSILIITVTGNKIYSQQADTLGFQKVLQLSFDDLLNVKIITASKTLRLPTEITQKVDIISASQIGRIISGNNNLAELIQYLPGASVKVLSRNDANWGAYGGIGPKYNTYMVQGLPVDAFIDPQSLDALAFGHIEVQRGPASILYPNYLSQDFAGNQCPLAGTVNFILKEQIEKPKTVALTSYGTFNTFNGQVYHENKFKKLHFFGGVSFEKSDYKNYGTEDSWLNMLDNPEYNKTKVFAGATLYLGNSNNHKIKFFGNQAFHNGDWGRIFRKYNFGYSLINISYNGKLANNIDLTLKTGIRNYDRRYENDIYNEQELKYILNEETSVGQLIFPTDFSLTIKHSEKSVLTAGADYQNTFYKNWVQPVSKTRETQNKAQIGQVGVYAQEELQLNKFTFRGGARFNIIDYNIDIIGGDVPGAKHEHYKVFLWSTGIKFRVAEDFVLYSNAGNSFMSPALKSIGGTVPINEKNKPGSNGQLPNPDLKPEKGISTDLGFDYIIAKNIQLSVRGFYTVLTDAILDIVVSQDPSQTMSINAEGETIAKGFELSLSQQVNNEFNWFANLTYTKSEIFENGNSHHNGIQVPFVPEFVSNMGFTTQLPFKINLTPWVHFGGNIYDSSSPESRNLFKSGELINIYASRPFNFKDKAMIDIYLKAYNITNNKYEMPWQFQDTGFNINLGVKIVL